ncbi:hypothetical protein [Terrabacter sp. NPDC080008]|uniref:hypothetical protein n=1 Tax=Terrabacter sp. NPDC080008 TaxID=3155176 RepID=UPI00344DF719
MTAPLSLAERAAAVVPALPSDAAFSHVTAAALHGLPLSYALESDGRLHVSGPLDTRRMRRPGVVAHRCLHPRSRDSVDGLPVVGLADTWVDLGELVGRGKPAGLDDLIVVGDAIATRLRAVAPLRDALMTRVRPRGKVTLLEALLEIRVGSASPRETLARLMLVRCGLPEPQLNHPVLDEMGILLGYADLLWTEQLVAGEYQGEEFHDGDEERARDGRRRTRFERHAGVRVEEIWKADMATRSDREACVLRFAEALGIQPSELDLSKAEPRFFSTYAMDVAEQRAMRRNAPGCF